MTIHNVPTKHLKIRRTGHIEKTRRNATRLTTRLIALQKKLEKNTREHILDQLRKEHKLHSTEGKTREYKTKLKTLLAQLLAPETLKKKNRIIYRELAHHIAKLTQTQESKTLTKLTNA